MIAVSARLSVGVAEKVGNHEVEEGALLRVGSKESNFIETLRVDGFATRRR